MNWKWNGIMAKDIKCPSCGNKCEILKDQNFDYQGCGLNNVVLVGIQVLHCKCGGESSPMIPKIREVHQLIAEAILFQGAKLRYCDIRFLRHQANLNINTMARYLALDKELLTAWETENFNYEGTNFKPPTPQEDLLIRYVTGEHIFEDKEYWASGNFVSTVRDSEYLCSLELKIRIDCKKL
jgi:DNA-binding transcriptional regulator YiaG